MWIKVKAGSEEALSTARRVLRAFDKYGIAVYADPFLASFLGIRDKVLREDMVSSVDMVVVVGGDGTLLRLFHAAPEDLPPILGVNCDRIGFLFDYDWRFVEELVAKIARGEFSIERRSVGKASVKGINGYRFISEVLFGGKMSYKMTRVEVYLDDEYLYGGRTDGLIVATTTGSSAHALSAGGPLIDPKLDVLVIVPLTPFSPILKPVIVSPARSVRVRVLEDSSMVFDGIVSLHIPKGSTVDVGLIPGALKLVKVPGGHSLSCKLRSRLLDLPPWSIEC